MYISAYVCAVHPSSDVWKEIEPIFRLFKFHTFLHTQLLFRFSAAESEQVYTEFRRECVVIPNLGIIKLVWNDIELWKVVNKSEKGAKGMNAWISLNSSAVRFVSTRFASSPGANPESWVGIDASVPYL